jgi:D-sedoheptulose 7-phosphate isomerase
VIDEDLLREKIKFQLEESASVKEKIAAQNINEILLAFNLMHTCIKSGGKIFLCGNGGSAADAQHIAAELVVRLRSNRNPMPAIALTTDTSILTAISNDYGFSQIFARQIEALGRNNDLLIGISTSGNSENVIKAVEYASENGIKTIALTGRTGGKLNERVNLSINVPSDDVQRIQEAHITISHIICDLLEQSLIGE